MTSLQDGTSATFSQIAAMHSELLAVNTNGQLCQWRWSDLEPFTSYEGAIMLHPKASMLGLIGEKVIGISACNVRASVRAESGKVRVS